MSATIMPDEHDLDDQYGPCDEPAVADTSSEERVVLTSILAAATHATVSADDVAEGRATQPVGVPSWVMARLKPANFSRRAYGAVYAAMVELTVRGESLEPYRLVTETMGQAPGMAEQVQKLCVDAVTAPVVTLDWYVDKIVEGYRLRRVQERVTRAQQYLHQGHTNRALELLHSPDPETDPQEGVGFHALRSRWLHEVENPARTVGFPWAPLNRELNGGMRPGCMYVVAGRPGTGKTIVAQATAFDLVKRGHSVLMFSLEMKATDLLRRVYSAAGGIPMPEIMSDRLSRESMDKLREVDAVLDEAGDSFWVDSTRGLTIEEIERRARAYARRRDVKPLGAIVVDYLQKVAKSDPRIQTYEHVSEVSRRLYDLAGELDVPLLVLAQLNRGSEYRDSRDLRLSDLRDSGQIEQDADVVIMLEREAQEQQDDADPVIVNFAIRKNRQGRNDIKVPMVFEGRYARFLPKPTVADRSEMSVHDRVSGGWPRLRPVD